MPGADQQDRSRAFREKVLLLLLAAAITALLVPYLHGRFEDRRALERMRAEDQRMRNEQALSARIAQEASVIRSQEIFLAELELLLSEYHSRAADVAWYRSASKNRERFAAAAAAYDSAALAFTRKIHTATSRAGRFTSTSAMNALKAHANKWIALDVELQLLMESGGSESDWKALLDRFNGHIAASGHVVDTLAADYGLRRTSKP